MVIIRMRVAARPVLVWAEQVGLDFFGFGQLRGGDHGIDHTGAPDRPWTTIVRFRNSSLRWTKTRPRPVSARDPYSRVLEPSLASSSSSWSNVSGDQPVAPDATAASSASFDG